MIQRRLFVNYHHSQWWWSKKLLDVLTEFTFMKLLIYLVYGRDKTFDMESMKAFRSLKAFKYSLMDLSEMFGVYMNA